MFYQVHQYIKFLLKSRNQHGVHSPFVYDLITKCFYDKTKYNAYASISNYRKSLSKNRNQIKLTDLDAGFNVMKQEGTVSKMPKNAGTTHKKVELLYRITHYFKPETVLELGTSLGISTQVLSLGNPKSEIITIHGCSNVSKFTQDHFKKHPLNNVKLITGNCNDEIKKLTFKTFDLIFFGTNHQKEATLYYFEALLKTARNHSVFIFDDIYYSKGITEAWETIKQHPKVTVTIDTFFWGIVFFRKEQAKEHFTIRV